MQRNLLIEPYLTFLSTSSSKFGAIEIKKKYSFVNKSIKIQIRESKLSVCAGFNSF